MSEPSPEADIADHGSGSDGDHKNDTVILSVKGASEAEAQLREALARQEQAMQDQGEELKRLQKLLRKQAKKTEAQWEKDQM